MIEELCANKDSHWFVLAIIIGKELLEYWLGKTSKVKAGSSLELILNLFKTKGSTNKERFMESGKLSVDLEGGSIKVAYNMGSVEVPAMVKLEVPAGMLLVPALNKVEEQIQLGAIDPIKGTDIDKEVMLKGIAELKKLLA